MTDAGRIAVVTGASSGIGAELARQLADGGFRVGLTARRVEALEALAAEIRDRGAIAAVAPADAADHDATLAAFARLAEELGGPIDLLIANAGLGIGTPVIGFSAAEFERMVRVNLLGTAYAIEAVLPSMLERRRGQIVGISSLAAYQGLPGGSGYGATKAGLSTLLQGLRLQLLPHGIHVTTVHPGYVRTPMTEGASHAQPFLMDAERACRIILKGVRARKRTVDFPWPMAALVRVARLLPGAVFDRLVARFGGR